MTDHGTLMLFGTAQTTDVFNALINLRTQEDGIGWSLSAMVGHCSVSRPGGEPYDVSNERHLEQCDYAACPGVLYYPLPLIELVDEFEEHVRCLANLLGAFSGEHHGKGSRAPARLIVCGEYLDEESLGPESLTQDARIRLHLLAPVLSILRTLPVEAPVFGAATRDQAVRLCALALDDLAGDETVRDTLWRSHVSRLRLHI